MIFALGSARIGQKFQLIIKFATMGMVFAGSATSILNDAFLEEKTVFSRFGRIKTCPETISSYVKDLGLLRIPGIVKLRMSPSSDNSGLKVIILGVTPPS